MLLPLSGKIVVIDDKMEDAFPLLKVLSKNNIPVKYYSGLTSRELPSSPLSDVRYIFLDIVLGTEGSSTKTKVGKTIHVLEKIIGDTKEYSPYIIIFWTKEKALINQIVAALPTPPITYLDLEKSECKKVNTDEYDIKKIENKIKGKLNNQDIFNLFTFWENMIHESTGFLVNEICSIYETNDHWETNIKSIIYGLAKAQLGQMLPGSSKKEKVKNSLFTLNRVLVNHVEKNTLKHKLEKIIKYEYKSQSLIVKRENGKIYKIQRLTNGKYSLLINYKRKGDVRKTIKQLLTNFNPTETADISCVNQLINKYMSVNPIFNSRILLDVNPASTLQPGNIYEKLLEKPQNKRKYLKTYFENINKKKSNVFIVKDLSKIKFIELEVTPICDYAQNKWLKSRILPGIMYTPESYSNLKTKTGDSLFSDFPLVYVLDDYYKMIFDFRLLKSVDKDKDENRLRQPIFKINQEGISSILSRLASHASRIGLSFLE